MGMFDDLIPQSGSGDTSAQPAPAAALSSPPSSGGGMFDDLIPNASAAPAGAPSPAMDALTAVAKATPYGAVFNAGKQVWDAAKQVPSALQQDLATYDKAMQDRQSSGDTGGLMDAITGGPAASAIGSAAGTLMGVPTAPLVNATKAIAEPIAGGMAYGIQAAGTPIAKYLNPNAKLPSHEDVYNQVEPEVETAMGLAVPGDAGAVVGRGRIPTAAPANPATADQFGVTLTEGEKTGDKNLLRREVNAASAKSGPEAYKQAQDFEAQRANQLDTARENISKSLDAGGQQIVQNPSDVADIITPGLKQVEDQQTAEVKATQEQKDAHLDAERQTLNEPRTQAPDHLDMARVVADELRSPYLATQNAAERATQDVAAHGEAIRAGLHPNGDIVANSPQEAADVVGDAIRAAEQRAEDAKNAAYQERSEIEGEYNPRALRNSGTQIRRIMAQDENPVSIDPGLTPRASKALQIIDETVGGKPPAVPLNEAAPPVAGRDEETGKITSETPPAPINGVTVEKLRQRLSQLRQDAWKASQGPGQAGDDARAMNAIIDAYDEHIANVGQNGGFSGDADALQDATDKARALHRNWKQTFFNQGNGDVVGPTIQKIVGKADQRLPPNQVLSALYGNNQTAPNMAARLQNILGTDSDAYHAVRQGLFSNITEAPEGVAPYSPEKVANRVHNALNGPGRAVTRAYLTPEEQANMGRFADRNRAIGQQQDATVDPTQAKIGQIVGDGAPPLTDNEVAKTLWGNGAVGSSPNGVRIAQHILDTQGRDSTAFQALRGGTISKLIDATSGTLGFDPEKIAANIRQFVNNKGRDFANVILTDEEKQGLLDYADDLDKHAANVDQHAADTKTAAAAPKDPVDKAIARITGSDGKPPATPTEITDLLYSRSGLADQGISTRLVQRLKQHFGENSPEYAAIKQGLFQRLAERPGNMQPFNPKQVADRFETFLNSSLGNAMLSPAEKETMQAFADMHRKMTIPRDVPNSSGTGHDVATRFAHVGKMISSGIGAMIGHHIFPGMGGEIGGMIAGAKANDVMTRLRQAGNLKKVSQQMPLVGDRYAKWQQAVAKAKNATAGPSQDAANAAAANLVKSLTPFGVAPKTLAGMDDSSRMAQNSQESVIR